MSIDPPPSQSQPAGPNLAEMMEAEDHSFDQAMLFVWECNPTKDMVRITLDDGTIRLMMRRDKFLSLLADVINIDNPGTNYNYFLIKESLHRYGGHYFYDRIHDEFRELSEMTPLEHIRPIDLVTESRKNFIKEEINNQFKELAKQNEEIRKLKTPWRSRVFESSKRFFSQVLRSLPKK
jgi:hypothetical protein